MNNNHFQKLNDKLLFFHRPFMLPEANTAAFQRNLSLMRIVFGVIVFYRYLDILGYKELLVSSNRILLTEIALVLCFCIAIGFFTQLSLILFSYQFLLHPPYASNLGDQATIIVCWLLLLGGSWEFFSLDRMGYQKIKSRLLKRLLVPIHIIQSPEHIAKIRFFSVFMFWGICFSATVYHFLDPMWVKGQTLQILFELNYMIDLAPYFRQFKEYQPLTFNIVCFVALWIQIGWELFLLPLFYFEKAKVFAVLQGFIFFISSYFLINLDYLPLVEIILWFSLFLYLHPISRIQIESISQTEFQNNKTFDFSVLMSPLVSIALCVVFISNLANIIHIFVVQIPFNKYVWYTYRTFAQTPVNVFNKEDMMMGSRALVLAEVKGSKIVRIVPFQDHQGGRLNYLRNSLLYFTFSLYWQRLPRGQVYISEQKKVAQPTLFLAKKVARLDFCLRAYDSPHPYKAFYIEKELLSGETMYWWKTPEVLATFEFTLKPKDMLATCSKNYVLSPGHYFSSARQKQTMDFIQDYNQH